MVDEQMGQPRLMIKEMVLENFKSYAGAQRVGPFHKCFSSVVGPNGSGKSNVIDAMLFVFGKKAKQLRLNKVSELIHNSTHHRNLDTAKVSVFFQEIVDTDDENYEIIPNSGFVVSRTAHRNNTSNYYINDKKSSFTEVTKHLKGKGIDLDNNRFLILQGEVEQISMMKAKAQGEHDTGLLEYLEDIIGTDKYVEKIEEYGKKLDELNEERQKQLKRVKVVQNERDALEDDKLLAESYISKEKEMFSCSSIIAQLLGRQVQHNLEVIDAKVAELRTKLEYEQGKSKKYKEDLKDAEAKFKDAETDYNSILAGIEKTNEEFKEYERKDIKYREDHKHTKAKLKKTEEKLEKDAAKVQAVEKEQHFLEKEVPNLDARVETLNDQLKKEEQALESLQGGIREEVEEHRHKLRGVKAQLAPWEAKIAEAQSRLQVAVSERDLLVKKNVDAKDKLEDAQRRLAAASSAAQEKTAAVENMRQEMQRCREVAEAARVSESSASAEVSRLEGALREVRGKVEQRRSDMRSQQSQGAVVRELMAAKAAGKVKGVYGRLGDLGAIDAKYDIAVSTSVGALDYIVVDSTSDAQTAVEYLRRNNLGVATFLILDKQQGLVSHMNQRVTPPEGVPRLFDLVKVQDDKLRVAFYYAMRDTVVADNLDQASRIAYGQDRRWSRVVTLKGEMINESGTMTGGGGKPKGGKMCLGRAAPRVADTRELEEELQQAEIEMNASTEALQEARRRCSEAAATLKEADRKVAGLETKILKVEMEAKSESSKASDLQKRLGELQKATQMSADDEHRIDSLSSQIASIEGELQQLQSSAAGLQAEAEAVQKLIDTAGGQPLKAAKAALQKTQKAISDAEGEVARKRVQITTNSKNLAKLAKDITKAEKEKEKLQADLKDIDEKIKDLEEAAIKVLDAVTAGKEVLAHKQQQLESVRTEYEQKQKEVGIIDGVANELKNTLEELQSNRESEGKKVERLKKEVEENQKKIAELDPEGVAPDLLTTEQLEQHNKEDLQYRATILQEELRSMNVNLEVIEKYRKKEAEYAERMKDLEAATAQRDEVRRSHEELRKKRLDEFMSGFQSISLKLKEMYQMITMGGDAELELVDSLDPFSEGIVFSVRPPKKSWKNITNLSGGEKTLSSLSLVFALHHYKPTPLYFMDEIDAALDFKNVSIVGHYIKDRTKNAQFIIISLRNNMFELADRLVGIYKTDNCTKSVAINPGEFMVGTQRCTPEDCARDDADENRNANVMMAA